MSGHGPDAAALGATLRSTWKALALAGADVLEAVEGMRRMLLAEKVQSGIFATIVAGAVDVTERRMSFVNAGHVPLSFSPTDASLSWKSIPRLLSASTAALP